MSRLATRFSRVWAPSNFLRRFATHFFRMWARSNLLGKFTIHFTKVWARNDQSLTTNISEVPDKSWHSDAFFLLLLCSLCPQTSYNHLYPGWINLLWGRGRIQNLVPLTKSNSGEEVWSSVWQIKLSPHTTSYEVPPSPGTIDQAPCALKSRV